ncbi:MAG: hypothetical protein WAQ33_05065 [Gaiellaceae bacterium]
MTRILATVLVALAVVTGAHAAGSGSITGSVTVAPVDPLTVTLTLSSPSTSVGGSVSAAATVRNSGGAPLANVVVVLTADPNLTVAGGETRPLGTIPGGGSASASWTLCALRPAGYVVVVRATAGSFGADSPAQVLNVSAGSGQCPKDASATLPAGGTLSTDREGDGATPASPVETAVTTPVAGTVTILEQPASFPSTGFTFLGQQVLINAPVATAAFPLRLVFRLEATLIGANAATLQVFRNGAQVAACTGAGATPDPCVSSRRTLPDGDVELVVFTSAASTWTFGTPIVKRGGVAAALTTSNRHVVALLVASDGTKLAGALSFDAFRSTKATALSVSGRTAWYAGFGTDGRPFLVYVEDNGLNGRGDVFRLWIGGVEQTTDGKLAKGDVAVTS